MVQSTWGNFWAAITKSNFQGLFNDIGNVLTIMLSNERKTLVGLHTSTTSMEGTWQAIPGFHAYYPLTRWVSFQEPIPKLHWQNTKGAQ